MIHSESDSVFAGSIAEIYDRCLVPLIFLPYAVDLASRVDALRPNRLLEIAAGTGVVTRELAKVLPSSVSMVATDLNQPMLDQAVKTGTVRPVEWRLADASSLPFPDEGFDVVVCQFAAMFFPDKVKAFREARRVLRSGGWFVFNVWDQIEENEFAHAVTQALGDLFPSDPPRFMARVPHGYHAVPLIKRHLREAGFEEELRFTTLSGVSLAETARVAALAYCQGTPLRNEIEARGPSRLEEAVDYSTEVISRRFGSGPVKGKIQAHVAEVQR